MDYANKSKEELIEELNALKSLVQGGDSNSPEQTTGDEKIDFSSILDGLMNFGGLDITGIQTEYIKSMLNNIPNPAYYMNSEGEFVGCNLQYAEFVGIKTEDIYGKKISDLFPQEIAEKEITADKKLYENGGMLNYETQFVEKGGGVWDLSFSKSVFKNFNGSIAGIICVINDLTEKRKAERALVESEAKLREANATKDKFFSIISHDLKSPFVTLMGMTEILSEDYDSLEEEERKIFISDIRVASIKSFSLIENLLQWANNQRGKTEIHPETFSLAEVAQESIELLFEKAKQKAILLTNDIPKDIEIYSDKNSIAFTIRNLMTNAIKFTKENGSVKISASEVDDNWKISITDTGIGLSKDDVEKLFRIDVSHKTIGSSREEKGTGLGLILCKEFVERNGGKVFLENSELDKGSTFSFTLPIKR
ncbi:MAG: PAS domain S-box protein [Bacteroidetes bacterium]|nr:PAS domain S-box protein [Bacteroidota bacterium]